MVRSGLDERRSADEFATFPAYFSDGRSVFALSPGLLSQIVEWQRKSGKVYMMMETVVYSREYLFAKELYDKGELGRIQFLRGSHQQDMEGWPSYWEGFPPMHYATHCVSPCLAILGKHAEHVVCHGSGRIDEDPKLTNDSTLMSAIVASWGIAFFEGAGCRVFLDSKSAVESPIAELVRKLEAKAKH